MRKEHKTFVCLSPGCAGTWSNDRDDELENDGIICPHCGEAQPLAEEDIDTTDEIRDNELMGMGD